MDLKKKLRHVMDFPKEGIDYIDVTTLLADGEAYGHAIDLLAEASSGFGGFDVVVAPESRGFIFGAPLAAALRKPFVPARKPGKLPWRRVSAEYGLEYGTDAVEMHADALKAGQRAVIVDDLLATGGTVGAVAELVEGLGGVVAGMLFLIELTYLDGRAKLRGRRVESIIRMDG
ncbi:MAG: adenine phosphoribosyltransferase [Oscillospiraceae bacterium]|nr:adenine phosphoribosyltransferase [Oscillospiraceae bacterium]